MAQPTYRPSYRRNLWMALLLTSSLTAFGNKDLSHRLGVGFSFANFAGLSALSFRYHPDPSLGLTGSFGAQINSGSHDLSIGLKFTHNAVREENALFFVGAGASIFSQNSTTSTQNGGQGQLFLGTEIFFDGLPNVGFQWEAGLALRLMSTISLMTTGGAFTNAAVHYYF